MCSMVCGQRTPPSWTIDFNFFWLLHPTYSSFFWCIETGWFVRLNFCQKKDKIKLFLKKREKFKTIRKIDFTNLHLFFCRTLDENYEILGPFLYNLDGVIKLINKEFGYNVLRKVFLIADTGTKQSFGLFYKEKCLFWAIFGD